MPGNNTTSNDVDIAALAASVGDDIFGSPADGKEIAPVAAAPVTSAPASSPTPAPEPWEALPKAWKKDMETHWGSLSPEVRRYVHNREQEVVTGINGYAKNAKAWEELLSPFQSVFQQAPNFNPTPVLQGLMQSHLALSNPNVPAAQKAQILQEVAKAYKIDTAQAAQITQQAAQGASQGIDTTQHPQFLAMAQRLQQLEGSLQSREQREYAANLAETSKTVEAFFSDKKNAYAEEVGNDILHLIRTGAAADLQSAYDMAIWSNPTVRTKMLALQAEQAAAATKPSVTNVEGTGNATKRGKSKSIEDTIDEIAAKHNQSR